MGAARQIGPWPLTGRSEELEELARLARDRESAGVVLYGPAGVGKTRLAEEALQLADLAGRPVRRAAGHASTREIPLGALAHLLPADLTSALGIGEEERMSLFHAARAELRRLAGSDRLVLLVDDVDLLDDTSVAVLVPLVMARNVFVIGTVRSGRRPPGQLSALHRDGHLERMQVGPLGTDQLAGLLHRVLGAPASEATCDELGRVSGGNLQVLTELVRGARERGVLVDRDGTWTLTGSLPTTAALDDLVREHLAGVGEAGLAVLELLAVCGTFGLADLESLHGASALEDLEADGLVTVGRSLKRMEVRLAHPLYGEVLRAGLPPLRLRRIERQLADIVESHGARRREDVLRVALWRLGAGGHVDARHLLRAARLALAGHDPELAERLVGAASADELPSVDAAEVLVEAYSMRGELEQLEAVVTAIWDDEELTDTRRALVAKRLADTRFYRAGDLRGALAAHDAARTRVTDSEVLAAIDAACAGLLAGAGRPLDALRVTDALGAVASPRTRVEIDAARATSLLSVGRYAEATAIARQAAATHAELPAWLARRGIALHFLNEAHALAYAGHYREARTLVEPAAERARVTGATGAWVWFEMTLAEIARDTGRGREAIRRFARVARAAPDAGQQAALVWAHVGVAQGHLLLGDCGEAAAALERADRVGESPVATSVATRERTRAWLDACRGDLASARQRIRDAVVPVRRDGISIFEVALCHDLARLGVADEVVGRLGQLAGLVEGPLAAIHAANARALVDRDAAAQAEVVDRYEAIDALCHAAEAAAELADLHRGRAENRLATAAGQRAAELANRAGGLHTPVLARGSGVEPLTGREREVALLAAAGRSSREIGDHLGLSVRTVETHLARVYRKLGIAGRRGLAGALAAAGTT